MAIYSDTEVCGLYSAQCWAGDTWSGAGRPPTSSANCPDHASCFAEEQPLLKAVNADFDGYGEKTLRVSSTCLIRVDHNRYRVPAEWANRVVSVRATADRLRIVAEDPVVAEHPRHWGRDQLICEPWH
jgi:hypothetical protein